MQDEELIVQQKNQVQSLKAKANYSEIQCEDAQRDLDIVKKENVRLKEQNKEIQQTNEVVNMIHTFEEEFASKSDHLTADGNDRRRSAL